MAKDNKREGATRRRLLQATGASVAGMTGLTGCMGGGGQSDGQNTTTSEGTTQSQEGGNGTTTSQEGGNGTTTNQGGVVRVRRTYDPESLDPAKISNATETSITGNLYAKVLEYEQGGVTLRPGLATDWSFNDAGTELTLTLREGVQFHKGYGELTAQDIQAHFERCADPDTGSTQKATLEQMGYEQLEVVNDYEVRLVTDGPSLSAPYMLADDLGKIPSADAVDEKGEDFAFDPIGAGPFQFESFQPNTKTVLTPFEDYYADGLPNLDRAEFLAIPENQTAWSSFNAKESDINKVTSSTRYEQLDQNGSVVLSEAVGLITRFVGFNTQVEPFTDKRVRQAMNYATNKQELLNAVYPGLSIPAKSIMAPDVKHHTADVPTYPHDPEKAQELLSEAGFGNGFETTMWVPQISRFTEPAEVFQSDWSNVGVEVNVQIKELGSYVGNVFSEDADVPMFSHSNSQVPVPDLWMANQFHSESVPPGSNWWFYENDQVDSWLEEATSTTNEEERAELWANIQSQINEDCPGIWVDHEKIIYAHHNYVKNFQADPTRRIELDWAYTTN